VKNSDTFFCITIYGRNCKFEKYHLEKIGIFGSFARREQANDIDLIFRTCLRFDVKVKATTSIVAKQIYI